MIYEILKVGEKHYSLRRGYTAGSVRQVKMVDAPSFASALAKFYASEIVTDRGGLFLRSTGGTVDLGMVEGKAKVAA